MTPKSSTPAPSAAQATDPAANPAVDKAEGTQHKRSSSWFQRRWKDAPFRPQPASEESTSSISSASDSSSSGEEAVDEKHPRAGNAGEKSGNNFPKNSAPSSNPFSRFSIKNDSMSAKGKVSKRDGRLQIKVHDASHRGYVAKALSASIKHHLGDQTGQDPREVASRRHGAVQQQHKPSTQGPSPFLEKIAKEQEPRPKLNIVIMVIGSRGDIQPFIKVGKILKEEHGHRVRVATHPAFKDFVETDCGLEFFSVGGDPAELMAFMVKNPGLIPSVETLRKGEVGRRRAQMAEMFEGFWRACVNASDDPKHEKSKAPFVADAIIANPPSFAHVHCAERLGCPLHIMFTFPYTPTQQFPHPLANIKAGNVDANYTNFMSYPLVEMMTWQGLGDLVNDFRVKTLGMEPVSTLWAPGQLYRLKVPYTYMWSPGLVPKPPDWGSEISIAGFVFLDLASKFTPPPELQKFLDQGDAPIYIGFGSIVLDKPEEFTKMIFAAVKAAGVRAVLNKGWGGFGSNEDTPDYIHMLDNTPHDWLFPRCKAVVHHGGAGTTAIGLKCAKPTMIVPFFGDQQFWGSMVAAAKAGAHECIPYKQLTTEKFTEGIKQCLSKEAQENVQKIADSIEAEGDGAANAVNAFHANLPMEGDKCMRCSVLPDRVAVWHVKHSQLRLSALAAELLVQQGKTSYSRMRLHRQYEWNDFQGAGGPLTGGASAVLKTVTGFSRGIGQGPMQGAKHVAHRAAHEKKKAEHLRRKQERADKLKATASAASKNAQEADEEAETLPEELGVEEVDENQKEQKQTTQEDTDVARKKSIASATSPLPEHSTEPATETKASLKDAAKESAGKPTTGSEKTLRPAPMQHVETNGTMGTVSTQLSADPTEPIVVELAKDAASGVTAPMAALAKLPMDLFVGVANGFHNLPRIYGDTTVRRPIRITGIYSGLRAAGSELAYGTYDAFTGVVTQPYHGARNEGITGFATGVGKGLGGLLFKECAAIIGPFGYTMKGVHRELTKSRTPVADVRRKRMAQGREEVQDLSAEDSLRAREAASEGWRAMAALWAEAERIKRGQWDPETNEERADGNEGRVLGMQVPGGRLVAEARGRVRLEREKEHLREQGAFESVEQMERAVQARRAGQPRPGVVSEAKDNAVDTASKASPAAADS